eukprot:jgi/Mesvir1/4075/Mv16599-RA.1
MAATVPNMHHGAARLAIVHIVILATLAYCADAQLGSECTSPIDFEWGQTVRGWTVGQEPEIGGACGDDAAHPGLFFWFRATSIMEAANYFAQVSMASSDVGTATTVNVYTSQNGSCEYLECAFQASAVEGYGFLPGGTVVYLAVSTGLDGAGFAIRTGGNGTQPNDMGTCPDVPVITLRGRDAPELVFERTTVPDMPMSRLPGCDGLPETKPVAWFKFMALEAGNYTIQIIDTTFDTIIYVYTGASSVCNHLTCIAAGDDGGALFYMSYLPHMYLEPDIVYFVAVHPYEFNKTGPFVMSVTCELVLHPPTTGVGLYMIRYCCIVPCNSVPCICSCCQTLIALPFAVAFRWQN